LYSQNADNKKKVGEELFTAGMGGGRGKIDTEEIMKIVGKRPSPWKEMELDKKKTKGKERCAVKKLLKETRKERTIFKV